MKLYHVAVEQEDDWYIGRVLERGGVTTQGRTLDELVIMLRDAIELMWEETDSYLELVVPSEVRVPGKRSTRQRRASA
jgi:predicted RNase H-like HicB family nuclease